ncbi:glucose-1-phosphate adenylyltransferase small subunit, chloroplastic/amyloplastic-like isoform X2 [Curcuma longa]|uniref:glucose-1-phosphate adenylyltransferase small subunit, chloroplastic/amyloplastic-like isoform X2 n=1 Tax=Curcuma longa TaxID=136217 RepID=UPI003D9F72FA
MPDFSFYDRSAPIYTQPRYLPPSKMLDADVIDSVIGEGCVIKNCKIQHSVIGLRSCISEGAIIEDTLLMGANYYETDADKRLLALKGSVPIGIGKNSHVKRAIIDKNARIGDNVKTKVKNVSRGDISENSKCKLIHWCVDGVVAEG